MKEADKKEVKQIYYDEKNKGLIVVLNDDIQLIQATKFNNDIPFTVFMTKKEVEGMIKNQEIARISEKKQIVLVCALITSIVINAICVLIYWLS